MINKEQEFDFQDTAYLVFSGQIYPIKKAVIKVGRMLENDLVLQDPLVSRFHAEIRYEDGKFYIVDLDSTGGTYLNNKPVTKSILFSGDIILLTQIPIMFMVETDSIKQASEVKTGRLDEDEEEINNN